MGLNAPPSDDAIYRDRGGDVGPYRPVLQGDVFQGVSIPGLAETADGLAAVVSHPCSMRRGPQLTDRITFAQVVPYQHLSAGDWRDGHYRVMPLPGLLEGSNPHHSVLLDEIGRVPSDEIHVGNRIATMSDEGMLLLQQRQIMNSTRFEVVDLNALDQACRPVLEEVELLEEWNEILCEGLNAEDLEEALAKEAVAFDDLMGTKPEGHERTLREMPLTPHSRALVRRVVREVLLTRIV